VQRLPPDSRQEESSCGGRSLLDQCTPASPAHRHAHFREFSSESFKNFNCNSSPEIGLNGRCRECYRVSPLLVVTSAWASSTSACPIPRLAPVTKTDLSWSVIVHHSGCEARSPSRLYRGDVRLGGYFDRANWKNLSASLEVEFWKWRSA